MYLRSYLRILRVYCRFVSSLAREFSSINRLLCKRELTELSEPTTEHQIEFYALIAALTIPLILWYLKSNIYIL